MTIQTALVILAVTTAGTFAMRGGLLLLLADRQLPAIVERSLRHVGPAVLAALTVSLAVGDGVSALGAAEVAGLLVACAMAWRTRNLLATLVAGMTVLLALDALL